jgi:MFS family permease
MQKIGLDTHAHAGLLPGNCPWLSNGVPRMSLTTGNAARSRKMTATHHVPSLWRNRDFLLLWSGQAISTVGTQVSQLAFPLLVLFLTHSPVQAGLVGALRALPSVVLSLPAGALIDRWDRQRVMVLCDGGRALVLGSIPLAAVLGRVSLVQLDLVALLEGTLFVFFTVAEAASLPRVVTKEQLAHATAQNQAAEGMASLLGPAVSGALYELSRLLPFLADAGSYAVSAVSLLLIRTQFQGERAMGRRHLLAEVVDGLTWLWHQPLLFFMALLSGGMRFLATGSSLVLIVLAEQQGASAPVIGLILGIAGIGSIVGSLLAPNVQRRTSFGQAIMLTIWAYTLCWPLYALAPNALVLGSVTAVLFICEPIYSVVNLSYRLAIVPDHLQGRVNGVVRLISYIAIPPGLALTGILLQRVGAVSTVLLLAGGFVLLALATTLNPHLRHTRPLAGAQSDEPT